MGPKKVRETGRKSPIGSTVLQNDKKFKPKFVVEASKIGCRLCCRVDQGSSRQSDPIQAKACTKLRSDVDADDQLKLMMTTRPH